MKKFFALFTRNWGLKLLALALAVIAYYTMREKTNHGALFLRPGDGPSEYPSPVKPPPAPVLAPDVPVPESPLNAK